MGAPASGGRGKVSPRLKLFFWLMEETSSRLVSVALLGMMLCDRAIVSA